MSLNDFFVKARDRLKLKRKTAVILCVNAGLLIFSAVFFGLMSWASDASASQRAAALWANGSSERYAQVSVFISDSRALSVDDTYDIRDEVAKKLKENSIAAEGTARLFIDAYSATAKVSVSGKNTPVDAMVTGIGGDFFFFHGFELMYGQLISGDDFLKDVVVIDDALAWRLYGAMNVVGFEITVGGRLCYVGGVVSRGDNWPDSLTYGEHSRAFISYEMLENIAPDAGITCYEIVLPDPVTGFGRGIVEGALKVDEMDRETVENSSRYSPAKLLGSMARAGAAMQTKAIAFPYWENAARAAERYAVLFLFVALAMLIFPAGCVLVVIIRAWKKKGMVIKAATDYYRRRQMEKWKNEHKDKEETIAEEEVLL